MIDDKKYIDIISNLPSTKEGDTSVNNLNITITQNGNYLAEAPYTGFGEVKVNVPNQTSVLSVSENGTYTPAEPSIGFRSVEVTVPQPTVQALNVTPTTSQQTFTASGGGGYSPVRVSGVTSAIDSNIKAANIKSGVSILGVTGNATIANLSAVTVTPTTNMQLISPVSPYNGFSGITVNAVTNAIDPNITASNIKSGVTILGVEGSYQGIIPSGTLNISHNGVFDVTNYASANVEISGDTPVINSLSITPSTSAQTINAPSGVTGYDPIYVSAVTSSIDPNISAGNIKSGVSILGVSGTVTELKGETQNVAITSTAGNTFTPSSGKNGITSIKVSPTNQNRTVTPTTSQQTLSVNTGYSGNGTITVNAVTSSIDSNITAGNIVSGVTILGVEGTATKLVGETKSVSLTSSAGNTFLPSSGKNGITSITVTPTNQAKTIAPSTSAQTITVPSNYSGFGTLTVNAVTSSIDNNITAGNIKSGVTILGVEGTANILNGETRTVSITSTSGNTFTPSSGKNGITSIKVTPTNQARTVTPSTSQQVLNVNSGYSGNGTVTVNAVTSSIDANISSGNIKSGVQILGVTGTYTGSGPTSYIPITVSTTTLFRGSPAVVNLTGIQTLGDGVLSYGSFRRTLSSQVDFSTIKKIESHALFHCFAETSGSGLGDVSFSALTTVCGSGLAYGFYYSSAITSLNVPNYRGDTYTSCFEYMCYHCRNLTSVSFASDTYGGYYHFAHAFEDCDSLTTVDFSAMTNIAGAHCFDNAFHHCDLLSSVDFSAVTGISGDYACKEMFYYCQALTSVNLSSLTTVWNYPRACANMFYNDTNLTSINMNALEKIQGEEAFYYAFYNTGLTSMSFPSLNSITGSGVFRYAFGRCPSLTSLSFGALKTTSFSNNYTNYFEGMLMGVTGCTVHFPSNLQSKISTMTGYPNFGGTNTTILFDLPATS